MLARMTHFSEWFDAIYRERGYEHDAAVARALGIQQSVIKRWREGSAPSIDNLRKVSRVLEVPMQQTLIAAGVLTEGEASVVKVPADPSTLTNAQLIAELSRRVDAFDDGSLAEIRAMRAPRSAKSDHPQWKPPRK